MKVRESQYLTIVIRVRTSFISVCHPVHVLIRHSVHCWDSKQTLVSLHNGLQVICGDSVYFEPYLQVMFAQWTAMFLKLVHVNVKYVCNKYIFCFLTFFFPFLSRCRCRR